MEAMGAGRRLVGREAELLTLREAAAAGREGRPSAVLVHGEAGIGKTALLNDVMASLEPVGCHVLFGSCLRFGADGAALLALTNSLSGWLRQVPEAERTRLFGEALRGEDIVRPPTGGAASVDSVLRWARAVEVLADDRPTVVVLDDLQWADQSTLDAISYLLNGFRAGMHLTLLLAYRDTELDEGHRLLSWLADVHPLGSVTTVALPRLDAWATEELVAALADQAAHGRTAEAVWAGSRGNPYLAELLVRSYADGAPEAGAPAPTELRTVLLGRWHRLTEGARRVTQLLAVGGRPVDGHILRQLAASRSMPRETCDDAVREAIGQGVVRIRPAGDFWFVHPLLAQVVAETVSKPDAAELHLEYAALWAQAAHVGEHDRAHRLALHFDAAGRSDEAFSWWLRAADEAGRLGAVGVAAGDLCRAVDLLPRLPAATALEVDRVQLLSRAAEACERAGRYDDAVRLYSDALAGLDRQQRPLEAMRMLLPLPFLRANMGQAWTRTPDEWLQCLSLGEGVVPCAEQSMALAYVAFVEVFAGDPAARAHAEHALQIAQDVGDAAARAWAMAVLSQTAWGTDEGLDLCRAALRLAREVGDTALLARTAVLATNSYQTLGLYQEAAQVAMETYGAILSSGQRHDATNIGAVGGQYLLALGRFEEARALVREMLSFRQARRWSGEARCIAAVLAARHGAAVEAQRHLQRAQEILPNHQPVGDPISSAQMQVLIELGEADLALALAERVMDEAASIDTSSADEYLLWAARAAADLAALAPSPAVRGSARERLRALEAVRTARNRDECFAAHGQRDLVHPAQAAVYRADVARCFGSADETDRWATAVAATRAAGLRYEEARSGMHLGRCLLLRPGGRRDARDALGAAARLAAEVGATALAEAIGHLAGQAHLDLERLDDPVDTRAQHRSVAGIPLTRREGEVLDHLVAGQTYAEIAKALYVSEKTVSSHVSHLLSKTGAANRIELTALVRGAANPPPRDAAADDRPHAPS